MPVKRQDPPSRNQARAQNKWGSAYADEASEIMCDPGKWYILRTYPKAQVNAAKSLYTRVQEARYRAFRPADAWDCTIASEEDRHGNPVVNVYVKYLGGG